MGTTKKTYNANLDLKVALRRQVLKAGGFRELRVLDLYAGSGQIWNRLRSEFRVGSYLPCDKQPRMAGTLKANLTPRWVEALARGPYNVVDVDTYGEPWNTWVSVARNLRQPAAVFLTHGVVMMGGASHLALEAMGIPREWNIPVKPDISRFAHLFFIVPEFQSVRVERAWRAEAGHAVYYGLLVKPLDKARRKE